MILLPSGIIANETRNLSCTAPYNGIHSLSNVNYSLQLTMKYKDQRVNFQYNEKSVHANMFCVTSLIYLEKYYFVFVCEYLKARH